MRFFYGKKEKEVNQRKYQLKENEKGSQLPPRITSCLRVKLPILNREASVLFLSPKPLYVKQ